MATIPAMSTFVPLLLADYIAVDHLSSLEGYEVVVSTGEASLPFTPEEALAVGETLIEQGKAELARRAEEAALPLPARIVAALGRVAYHVAPALAVQCQVSERELAEALAVLLREDKVARRDPRVDYPDFWCLPSPDTKRRALLQIAFESLAAAGLAEAGEALWEGEIALGAAGLREMLKVLPRPAQALPAVKALLAHVGAEPARA